VCWQLENNKHRPQQKTSATRGHWITECVVRAGGLSPSRAFYLATSVRHSLGPQAMRFEWTLKWEAVCPFAIGCGVEEGDALKRGIAESVLIGASREGRDIRQHPKSSKTDVEKEGLWRCG